MAFSEQTLEESAKKLWHDVLRAGVCFDLAWFANSYGALKNGLKNSYEAHSYQTIFHSLMADSTMSLLRAIDTQRGTASIPTFLNAVQKEVIYEILLAEVSSWPQNRADNVESIRTYLDMQLRILMLDFILLKRHEKSLKVARNRLLAHAGIVGPRGVFPKFSSIYTACSLAALCSDRIRVLCTGSNADTEEFRNVQRSYAKQFWHTFSLGLGHDDRDQWPDELDD